MSFSLLLNRSKNNVYVFHDILDTFEQFYK
jgi:hypothetical protein